MGFSCYDGCEAMLAPPKPIAIKERISMIFLQYGEIDVLDGAFVLVDKNGIRTHIPVGGVACLMLEPGYPCFPCCLHVGGASRLPSDLGR